MPIDPAARGDAEKPAVAERGGDRLSVVIPTYNRRELVLRAIESVLDRDAVDTDLL